MSKTAETLKRTSFRRDVLDNHIADTYFYQRSRPKIRKKKTINYLKTLYKSAIPLGLTAVLVVILIAVTPAINARYQAFLKNKLSNTKIIRIIERGNINRELVRNYELLGLAKKASGMPRGAIVLQNPKKYNWADLAMNFKFPINLTDRSLLLSLRGGIGGEKISVVLRDVNNRTYRVNDLYLSSKWTNKIIRLNNSKGSIDLTGINHIRIECGRIGESAKELDSPIGVTVYIKNLNLPKET